MSSRREKHKYGGFWFCFLFQILLQVYLRMLFVLFNEESERKEASKSGAELAESCQSERDMEPFISLTCSISQFDRCRFFRVLEVWPANTRLASRKTSDSCSGPMYPLRLRFTRASATNRLASMKRISRSRVSCDSNGMVIVIVKGGTVSILLLSQNCEVQNPSSGW